MEPLLEYKVCTALLRQLLLYETREVFPFPLQRARRSLAIVGSGGGGIFMTQMMVMVVVHGG